MDKSAAIKLVIAVVVLLIAAVVLVTQTNLFGSEPESLPPAEIRESIERAEQQLPEDNDDTVTLPRRMR